MLVESQRFGGGMIPLDDLGGCSESWPGDGVKAERTISNPRPAGLRLLTSVFAFVLGEMQPDMAGQGRFRLLQ